jgi:hypothetical protein
MRYPDPPQNILDFARMFPDEQACADYLFQLRWPNGFVCPKCGSTKVYKVRTTTKVKASPGMVQCDRHHKTSVTAGTALHRTKQPLVTWFHAAWLVSTLKPGISAVQLQRQLGIHNLDTAWALLHKLRSGMVAPERAKLTTVCSDPTHTDHWVEIDEVYVGGKEEGEEHRGRGAETKSLIAVAVEVHSWEGDADPKDDPLHRRQRKGQHVRAGRGRMKIIPDATGKTLEAFISENVAKGSTIWTDAHLGYNKAGKVYPRRITVAKAVDDPLPTLGRVVTNLKRWLMGTHKGAVRAQHLQAYLNEFVFRFNRRDIPWIAFNRVLGLAVDADEAAEYQGLYKGTWIHPNPEHGLGHG